MIFRRRRAKDKRAEEPAVEESAAADDDSDLDDDTVAEEDASVDDSAEEDETADDLDDEDEDEDEDEADDSPRADGPWDVDEDFPEAERIDLGSLQVPVVDGFEIQIRMDNNVPVAANVLHGDSGLEIMACAAPKTGGLWDELRSEMIKGLKSSGGKVASVDGTFGRELIAEVPVTGPDGTQGTQHVRFFGIDGPRWFLRGAFSGRAVDEPKQAVPLEDILRGTVVDRGQEPMAPRELIPMDLPRDAKEALGLTTQEDDTEAANRFKSFRRAPDSAG
ncbi:MAG: DUF3710 domain-containing protein [Streptosporangiales bacterium]|nr:DUF3710 domain-containing protein [Streptosporangiales bacterium]